MEMPTGMMGPLQADEELQALLETVEAAAEPAVVPVAYRKRPAPAAAASQQFQPKQIKLEPLVPAGESYGMPPAAQFPVADRLNNETNHRKTKVYIQGSRMLKTEEL